MHKHHTIITIALFGSLWGLIEATLGGILHLAHIPYTGTVMASFGLAILYAALRSGVRPAALPAVALVAAAFKFLDAPLFGLPIFTITIANPAVAIATQGLAFSLVFWRGTSADRIASIAPRFLIAAAAGMVAFNAISVWGFGWPTNHTQHPWNTVLVQLPLMAIGATAITRAISALADRVHVSPSLRWQAAAAAACAMLALAARASI